TSTIVEAYKAAYESDTVSAFGSIIAVNRTVTLSLVESIGSLFVDVLVAPEYDEDALKWLSTKKKNCRVMKVKNTQRSLQPIHDAVIRSVHGGILVQTGDKTSSKDRSGWKVVTEKQPDEKMWKDLEFAWAAVKHVK